MKKFPWIIPLLLACGGFFILHSQTYFMPLLSTGDHGRDLYAVQAVLAGQEPYRDFWWVYGPVMPYYYAIFYALLGGSIKSILIGRLVLNILSGILFYRILVQFIPTVLAVMGALWFWSVYPDFFFTFNHTGGITMMLALLFALVRYMQTEEKRFLWYTAAAGLSLSLIKINFGFIGILMALAAIEAAHVFGVTSRSYRKWPYYLMLGLGVPLVAIAVHAWFARGLSIEEIRQCFPYLSSDHPHNASFWRMVLAWWNAIALNINTNWANRCFSIFLVLCIGRTFHSFYRRHFDTLQTRRLSWMLAVACIYYLLNCHEFLVSGVLYRVHWAAPLSMLMIFLFFGAALARLRTRVMALLCITLLTVVVSRYNEHQKIIESRINPNQYLYMERGRIFVGNSTDWIQTVFDTTAYLKAYVPPYQHFLALPYDPLYYYLTDTLSPTRQLIFFDHINIDAEQEKNILAELTAKPVPYVLLTSRINSGEPGLGIFGKTYTPLLGRYVAERYTPAAQTGDWSNPPGWGWFHGTMILKEK